MGTSVSFRAPAVPRWQAFSAALRQGEPIDRLRSELFNAGLDWEEALAGTAVASYAASLLQLHDQLPDQLRQSETFEAALQGATERTRAQVSELPPSAAVSLADRAFVAVLIQAVGDGAPLAGASPVELAARFESGRGEASDLVARYLGELLSQYARHVTAREVGALTESGGLGKQSPPLTVRQGKVLTRALAQEAGSVAASLDFPSTSTEVRGRWREIVQTAFESGRTLPSSRA